MDNVSSLFKRWNDAKKLPMRDRIKAFRTLGYQAVQHFHEAKDDLTAEQVLNLSKILSDMIAIHSFGNEYASTRNKMLAAYFEKVGGTPNLLLQERIFKNHFEGIICVADATQELNQHTSDNEFINRMNNQEAFYFEADDTIVDFIIVECQEPLLPLDELKKVIASTSESGVISCASGQLRISLAYNDPIETVTLNIKPAYYKIAAHLVKKRSSYYCIICACETTEPFPTKTKIDSLNDYE